MTKLRFRIPFVGFAFTLFAFVATLVALTKYYNLYSVAGYATNWWTVLYSALPALFLAVILVNSILLADDPFFMIVFYIASAFMLVYGALAMLQPCISEIAFVIGSPDLAMGDNEIRVFISDNSITTTVWYVIAAVCTIIGAFTPNMLMRKDERLLARKQKTACALCAYNKKLNKLAQKNNVNIMLEPMPDAPAVNNDLPLPEQTDIYANYAVALYDRLKYAAKKVRVISDAAATSYIDVLTQKSNVTAQKAGLAVFGDTISAQPAAEEVL